MFTDPAVPRFEVSAKCLELAPSTCLGNTTNFHGVSGDDLIFKTSVHPCSSIQIRDDQSVYVNQAGFLQVLSLFRCALVAQFARTVPDVASQLQPDLLCSSFCGVAL